MYFASPKDLAYITSYKARGTFWAGECEGRNFIHADTHFPFNNIAPATFLFHQHISQHLFIPIK